MRFKFLKMDTLRALRLGAVACLGAAFMSSCVHQFPEGDDITPVVINVVQETEWLPDYIMDITRAYGGEVDIRYDFRVYPKGNTTDCIKEFSIYKDDLTRQEYTTYLEMLPGDYDLWCWSDYCEAGDHSPIYYDDSNFANITYIKPYEGDTDLRDTFRGMTSFSVKDPGMEEPQPVDATIVLTRPMARYMFIATDLAEFIDRETTRGKLIPNGADPSQIPAGQRWAKLTDYKVKVVYPMYMPAVFDNFKNNPIDSWTGISFDCTMLQLNADEARMAMDYVYVNGEESGVQVMMELYDPDGTLIARTNTITVPTKRDRTTIVRGKFLTTLRTDGVGIDPSFDGEFNIELP